MIILDYQKQRHQEIIQACVRALKAGKIIAYPTDTCYGLAADASNVEAIKKLYKIKERQSVKPVHVIVPSLAYAKKIVSWNSRAALLAKKFLPGPLTLVLGLKSKSAGLNLLSAKTDFLGIRMPKNLVALDLAKFLKNPITTTSANPSAEKSGGHDSYSAAEVVSQFAKKKFQPDIIINAGILPKQKPSTLIKINQNQSIQILRVGPISEQQIKSVLSGKG